MTIIRDTLPGATLQQQTGSIPRIRGNTTWAEWTAPRDFLMFNGWAEEHVLAKRSADGVISSRTVPNEFKLSYGTEGTSS